MPLTSTFRETVLARAQKDPNFSIKLLEGSINEFFAGDLEAAKSLLRDYVNSGITFEKLSKKTKISDKSLQRMLSSRGNPTSSNFCAVLHAIQELEGVAIGVKIRR